MKRFGKARVPGCECTYNFTCRPCLADAAPRGQLIARAWAAPADWNPEHRDEHGEPDARV